MDIILAIDCGRLQSPLNGSLSGNLTVYPNSVRLWCDPGFVINGSSIRTCQSNGTWDGFETFCEGKTVFKVFVFGDWLIRYGATFDISAGKTLTTTCSWNVSKKRVAGQSLLSYFELLSYLVTF